jgi:hypothetical protein
MVESGRWNRELDQKLIDMGREIGYDELVDYLFYLVPPHHSMPPSISLDETFEKALTKSQENCGIMTPKASEVKSRMGLRIPTRLLQLSTITFIRKLAVPCTEAMDSILIETAKRPFKRNLFYFFKGKSARKLISHKMKKLPQSLLGIILLNKSEEMLSIAICDGSNTNTTFSTSHVYLAHQKSVFLCDSNSHDMDAVHFCFAFCRMMIVRHNLNHSFPHF